jgi:hypothetical protein
MAVYAATLEDLAHQVKMHLGGTANAPNAAAKSNVDGWKPCRGHGIA